MSNNNNNYPWLPKKAPMKNRLIFAGILLIAMILFAFIALGCSVNVKKGDSFSVKHWELAKQRYIEDTSLFAGYDQPREMTAEDFPVGTATWDDYSTTLGGYDTWIKYEQLKIEAENPVTDEEKETEENTP